MTEKLTASDRLRQLRELMGMEREEFSALLGLDLTSYKNLELKRKKMGEEEFAAVAHVLPDFLHWIVAAKEDDWNRLVESQIVWTRLIGGRLEAGIEPSAIRPLKKSRGKLTSVDKNR